MPTTNEVRAFGRIGASAGRATATAAASVDADSNSQSLSSHQDGGEASTGGVSVTSPLTWDHFFEEFYDLSEPRVAFPTLLDKYQVLLPGAPPPTDEGACGLVTNQQAMTSSPQDLDAAGDSPAPPAVSPLTDPADPGNREPFPPVDLDLALDPSSLPATHPDRPASQGALLSDAHNLQLTAYNHNLAPDAPMADLHQLPANDYFPESLDAFPGGTYAGWPSYIGLSNVSNNNLAGNQTVHPSLISSDANMAGPSLADAGGDPDRSLESFARIEFADSVFQMTTYAVIIGRDQNALNAAKRDKRRADEHQLRVNEARANGLPDPPTPTFGTLNKFSKSYVSNEGGMLGPESDEDDYSQDRRVGKRKRRDVAGSGELPAALDDQDPRAGKRRKRGLSDSGGQPVTAEPDADDAAARDDPRYFPERQYVSHTPGAVAVNVDALRTSPTDTPFLGIHSPHPNIISGTKGISRRHLEIRFSSERGVFEAIAQHKNGFFVGDTFYKEDERVALRSGDTIQIKDVTFNFIINGVPRGKTGGEEYAEESEAEETQNRTSEGQGPKEMCLAFETSHAGDRKSTSAEVEDGPEDHSEPEPVTPLPKPGVTKVETPSEPSPEGDAMELDQDASGVIETIEDDGDEDAEGEDKADGEEKATPVKLDLAEFLGIQDQDVPFKKRGPGRPPKNGIMSKREERLRRKAALELAKQNMPQPPPGEPPIKRKVGRPRKHPLPDEDLGGDRPEKRKYKPRKKNGEEGGESEGERVHKEKRREKPKTPPLELDRSQYTEEQLQKPNKNYGVLIDEVLTAALPDGLTLKQIYKRIQMKYPFYYFTVDTKGWESSVRHNLIGNVAFQKNEETHLWCRVPGIDIDAGKKRKAPSPDNAANMQNFNPQYATPASYGAVPNYHQAGAQPAGYTNGPPAGVAGQPLRQHPGAASTGVPLQAPRQPYQNQGQAPATQAPAYQQAAGRPHHGVAPSTSYSAPYAPANAPIAMAAQPGATPHSMARQYAQPPNGAVSNGIPQAHRTHTMPAAQLTQPVARPQQPAAPGPAPLKPAVAPEFVKSIVKFKTTARDTLAKLSPTPDGMAAFAVHRALGLTTRVLEPSDESLMKILIRVFETNRTQLTVRDGLPAELTVLHPDLLQTLLAFRDKMIPIIEKMVAPPKSEQLILSAVDRTLGFADRSNMSGTGTPDEIMEYIRGEDVLIPVIRGMVVEHQKRVVNAALKATTPSAGGSATYQAPGTAGSAPTYRPTAPGPAPVTAQRPLPQTGAAPSSSATPAAMYWSAPAPAAALSAVAYPPRQPVQAANAHAANAPGAPPAGYRAPQPAPSANPAASQPRTAPPPSAAAKCASAPPDPALATSAPAVPRASAPPSVPAAPSVYTPQPSFTPQAAKAALPAPAAPSSRPMPPTAAAPTNTPRAPPAPMAPVAPMAPAAPMSAAPLPAAPTPAPPMTPPVAPPATMMASAPPPAANAPAPTPAPGPAPGPAPSTVAHTIPHSTSPPLSRAAPPVTTPSLPTVTTAP